MIILYCCPPNKQFFFYYWFVINHRYVGHWFRFSVGLRPFTNIIIITIKSATKNDNLDRGRRFNPGLRLLTKY